MRRMVILALYFSMGLSSAIALPGRFSAECSPSCAINRVYSRMKPPLCTKGNPIRLHFGGAYHFLLQEYVSLSVGISYALSHMEWTRTASASAPSIHEAYSVRYLWVPFLCRFYTSEVMIDTSIYCKLGLIPSIHLPRRSTALSHSGKAAFLTQRPLGCFILLGSGVKYDFSLTNSLVVGLSYCWDVSGVMYREDSNDGSTYLHNNFVFLDFCFLF
ncbi:hypothetical protein ACRRVA_00265 [Candidatus Cardinium hertigii]|uniref:hypothetical protein n=1 Tax=Candidatus Cardinium hertigii TaxID=247481 RepID=UPI003D7E3CE0